MTLQFGKRGMLREIPQEASIFVFCSHRKLTFGNTWIDYARFSRSFIFINN